MNYPDSVRFLYALGNEIRTAKLGLERIRLLLEDLGSPHLRGNFVHVAGTNGKGSTAAMIEAGLRAHGLRTGLFTSPHLVDPTERIQIDGRAVSRDEFAEAFDRVHEAAERLLERGTIDLHPTYFETATAMALVIFERRAVDTAVMEVGLGGRLDATNVIRPRVGVITPVDFDHEALLGRSIESIAAEKAGILKPGVPAVFAAQREEAARVLDETARAVGAPVRRTSEWRVEALELSPRDCRFIARGPRDFAIECPLAGEHQAGNALTAAVALDSLGVPAEAIRAGIAGVRWPGRLQRVSESPEVILDGAPQSRRCTGRWRTISTGSTPGGGSGSSTAPCATRRWPR